MQPVVETLSGLKRRVVLSLSLLDVEKEVQGQLKRVARTVKVPGFRPGKVPIAMLERSHGSGIRYDVINTRVSHAFEAALRGTELRMAGAPSIEPQLEDMPENMLVFTATFEVYPDISLPELSELAVTRYHTPITDAELEQTIEVLRKQRATYESQEGRAVQEGDRIKIDFAGTIDDIPFEGGQAEDYSFVVGEGQMLPEFEAAVQDMHAGETKLAQVNFPDDYQGQDVRGKTAEFKITVKDVAQAVLPALDAEFAQAFGQAEGDIEKLKADVRKNIEREANLRVQGRTKNSVMEALAAAATFEVPDTLVKSEAERRVAAARETLKQRGVANTDSVPIPTDAFTDEAKNRVRLALLLSELVKQAQLQPNSEQVQARIEAFAQSYEKPDQIVSYYASDRERRAEIEAIVVEDNVVSHVLEKAKVASVQVPFDELMGIA
jgi:trigger factor